MVAELKELVHEFLGEQARQGRFQSAALAALRRDLDAPGAVHAFADGSLEVWLPSLRHEQFPVFMGEWQGKRLRVLDEGPGDLNAGDERPA